MSAVAIDNALLLAAVEALPDDSLASVRRVAAEQFAKTGFPTIGNEDWKYTNLSDVALLSNDWLETAGAEPASVNQDDLVASVIANIDAHWLIIRDGMVDTGDLSLDGVNLERLATGGVERLFVEEPLSAFNAALLRDGLHVRLDAGACFDRPLGVLYVDSASNAVAQTRVVVDAGERSRLQLVELSLSGEPGRQFTNAVCELNIARGAAVDHVRIQNRQSDHAGVNRVVATLASDAEFHHNSFDLGGGLTRNDVIADISGRGAAVSLNGLYLASGDQHIDNHTSILHRVGPATSTEEYRGILAGRSQCVFNGKVVVSEGADGTDSSQSNYNLLLSERAEIDTKPELEIYADDVKCAHGATVGQLDETALFYLRSRGLDDNQARQVLTRAFAAGTLSELTIDACHDYLAGLLDSRLESLVGEPQ